MRATTHPRLDYIKARPVYERHFQVDALEFYFGRYRGFAAEPHVHPSLQVLVPVKGRMLLNAGQEAHLLGPEWCALIGPSVAHAFSHVDGELEFLAVDLPGTWLDGFSARTGIPVPFSSGALALRDMRFWSLAQHLIPEIDAPQPGTAGVLAAGFELLATYLLRSLASGGSKPTVAEPRVLRAVDRIMRDYAEELSIDALAAEVAMSARHFERCFKEEMGSTPKRFLIEIRMGAARELLASSSRSISDIALEIGFKNPSHFAETFQRIVGETPSAYRAGRAPAPAPATIQDE